MTVVKCNKQLLKYPNERIQRTVLMVDQELGQAVAIDRFHDNVEVSLVEEILLNLDDIRVVQVLQVLYLLDSVNFVFILYGHDLANAFDLAHPVDHLANETGGTAIDDFWKVVKFEHLPHVVFHKLPITYPKIVRRTLRRSHLAQVFLYRRFATHRFLSYKFY